MNNDDEIKFEYSPSEFRTLLETAQNDFFMNFMRGNLHRFIRWYLKTFNQFKIINHENLSKVEGSFVLISNHSSHLDVITLFSCLPLDKINNCFSVAARDYFFANDVIAYLTRLFFNSVPFSRNFSAHSALKACGILLDQGKSLILFPEGTRSLTGQMASFKPGIGILMAERKHPVIPIYLKGNYEAYPKGAAGLPKRLPLTAIIGEPMVFEQYASTSDNWYHIAKEVENRVVELKNQLEQMTTKG